MTDESPEELSHNLARSGTRGQEVEHRLGRPGSAEGASRGIAEGLASFDSQISQLIEGRPLAFQAEAEELLIGIVIWLKAFIPRDVPPLTRLAPGWGGATMLDDPYIPGCYLTDSRGFSNNFEASARMTSAIAIFPPTMRMDQLHYCDYTVRLDCDSGESTCHNQADASRMNFTNFRGVAGRNIEVDLVAAAANPCAFGAQWFGDIDIVGTIAIDTPSRQVLFQGYVDPFPAFEMYAAALTGPVPSPLLGAPLFTKGPNPGATPRDLPGAANQFIWGIVTV